MTQRRKTEPPTHGPGYTRMVNRLGPEKYEELRQSTLKDQLEARAKFGAQPVNPRDRETYKDYPISKHTPSPEAKARTIKRLAQEVMNKTSKPHK